MKPRGTKDRLEVRSLEEQSFELFRQDIDLLRLEQEYKATEGYKRDYNYFQVPGRVLHLDGDPTYLSKCLDLYKQIGVTVYGIHCDEKEMHLRIASLIDEYRPDILVITGHDSYSKTKGKKSDLNSYRHSKYFVQTVIEAQQESAKSRSARHFCGGVPIPLRIPYLRWSQFCKLPAACEYTCP